MLSRKLLFLVIGGLLISGVLVACGDTADFASGAAALATASPSATLAAKGNPSTGAVTAPATKGSGTTTETPLAATPPAKAANPVNLDPCSLFTKEDFLAVFKKEANDPDQWEGVCDFQFAETLVPGSDEAFGLTVRLDAKTYTLDKFIQMARQLAPQKVDGVGDAAYLKPSQSEDESTVLLVLKGNLMFALELLQPAAVKADQRLGQLETAAQKVLAHLAAPAPVAAKAAPTGPAGSGSGPASTPAAGGNLKAAAYDPCQLFTRTDFATVLNSQPQTPQKDEDVAAYSCNYQSATTDDTISLYLQKEAYDKAHFEAEWKDQPYITSTNVKGLGEEALWTEGSVSRLYVLKGNLAFWFELTLENDKTPDQKLEILKKSAERVLDLLK